MGVIQPADAVALAAEISANGKEARRILGQLATHFAETRIRIANLLAMPESDAEDRAKIIADLQGLIEASDALRAEAVSYIQSLQA